MSLGHVAFRLRPGADLRDSLLASCDAHGIEAGCVLSGVGSLRVAALRFAGRDTPATLAGDLEIVSLTGTVSRHGCHLHIAVADAEGRVTGGHLLAGSIVRTTAEIVLGVLHGVRFVRADDPATGYRELEVQHVTPAEGAGP